MDFPRTEKHSLSFLRGIVTKSREGFFQSPQMNYSTILRDFPRILKGILKESWQKRSQNPEKKLSHKPERKCPTILRGGSSRLLRILRRIIPQFCQILPKSWKDFLRNQRKIYQINYSKTILLADRLRILIYNLNDYAVFWCGKGEVYYLPDDSTLGKNNYFWRWHKTIVETSSK